MLLTITPLVCTAFLASLGHAADIRFYSDRKCDSTTLYRGAVKTSIPCYALSNHQDLDPANSTGIDDIQNGQRVILYSDMECKHELYAADTPICYVQSDHKVAAFKVDHADDDVLPSFDFAMSNSKDLAVVPQSVELPKSALTLGVGFLIGAGATLVALSGEAVSCAYADGSAPSLFGCIASPVATVGTFISHFITFLGRRRAENRYGASMGQFTQARSDSNDMPIDQYMALLFNGSDPENQLAGYIQRDMGTGLQTSPVWAMSSADGSINHVTAFHDHEMGGYIHSLVFPEIGDLTKRAGPGYEGVRWKQGGLDFKVCEYNGDADVGVFSGPITSLYNSIYQDIRCTATLGQLRQADGITLDLYNGAGTLITQNFITAFDSSGVSHLNQYGQCGKITSTVRDQNCVY